jgi:allantoate deiminase
MVESKRQTSADGLRIDLGRLRSDIEAVNAIGRLEGVQGINRVSFSDADMAGRRWLIERLEDAGLDARMDGVGNVFGRWSSGTGPVVMAGSHLDTVPMGGQFDGTLGVCAALEAVRAIKDVGIEPVRPIEVVCTSDEEGRFGGMLGSQAICGEVGPDWIATAVDDTGLPLVEAMRAQGLDPDASVSRDPADIAVFLELHIEQGPVLEQSDTSIGLVDAISGVFNWTITLTGTSNHSGTTPMDHRRDAFRGLADFGAAIPKILDRGGGPDTRLTVGKVTLEPNYPHSIAGEAVFSIVGRDPDERVMRGLAQACRAEIDRAAASHGLVAKIAEQSWLPPTRLDSNVVKTLGEIAGRSGFGTTIMSSGAGHDAQIFARHCAAGLIFVPSVGGVSHSPEERTNWGDIECGANLLARAIATIALDADA